MSDATALEIQRGNYDWSLQGPLLFSAGRLACIPLQYYLITAHPLSILGVPRPPTDGTITLPILPTQWATQPLLQTIFLGMTSTLIVKQTIWSMGISKEFMTVSFATFAVLADFGYEGISALVFSGAASNPLWRPEFMYVGAVVHFTSACVELIAELQRKSFKEKPENKGKLCTSGLWGVCRHPNFAMNTIYGFAYGFAAGGPIFGLMTGGLYWSNFALNAIKPKEDYMAKKYGEQWGQYRKDVKWKLIPGIY